MSTNPHHANDTTAPTAPTASIDDLAADIRAAGLRSIDRYSRWDQTIDGLTDACTSVQPATPHPTRVQPPNVTADDLLSPSTQNNRNLSTEEAAPGGDAETDLWDLDTSNAETPPAEAPTTAPVTPKSTPAHHAPLAPSEQPTAEHAVQPPLPTPAPAAPESTPTAQSEPDRTATWAKRAGWLVACLIVTPLLLVVPLTLRATRNSSRRRRIVIVGCVTVAALVMAALMTTYANTID